MKVVLTEAAEADLEAIGDRIAADNPERAVTFIGELRDCCAQLAHAPRAYPVALRIGQIEIRRRLHRDYLLFYRIRGEAVEILHLLHGARDYRRLFTQ